jgi:hypothetical protein
MSEMKPSATKLPDASMMDLYTIKSIASAFEKRLIDTSLVAGNCHC